MSRHQKKTGRDMFSYSLNSAAWKDLNFGEARFMSS
jgi:hypothetical protein